MMTSIKIKIMVISLIVTAFFLSDVNADSPPTTINYQGYLTDGSNDPVDGSVDMELKIYEALTGGTEIYAETHSNVDVSAGMYSLELGSGTATTGSWSSNPDFSQALWLEITINSTDTLSPRIPLKSSPYSRMALDVADGVVTASKLDGSPGNGSSGNLLTSDGSGGFSWGSSISASLLDGSPGNGTGGQILTSDGSGGFSWKSSISATLTGNATGISTSTQATVQSTQNSANSIYIHSNGGTDETIKIHSDQGTGDSSVELTSDVGGVSINAASGKSISMGNDGNEMMEINDDGISLESTKALYFGDSNSSAEGDWRIIRDGDNLAFQRYESSSWVTKVTITD